MTSMICFDLPMFRRLRSLCIHCYLPPHSMQFFSLLWFERIKEQLLRNMIREGLNFLQICVIMPCPFFSPLFQSEAAQKKSATKLYILIISCWAASESVCLPAEEVEIGRRKIQTKIYKYILCTSSSGRCIEMIYLFIQLLIHLTNVY